MSTVLNWRKSSYSGQANTCVEVAVLPDGGRLVRDTKDRDGGTLRFTAAQWHQFTEVLKRT
jgi:hypothetical protein